MTRIEARVPNWMLIVALWLAVILACTEGDSSEQRTRAMMVQPTWQQARDQPGHRVHVTDRQIACTACHSVGDSQSEGPDRFDRPRPERCVACHKPQAAIRHAVPQAVAEHGAGSPSDCMSCHTFAERAAAAAPRPSPEITHAQRPPAAPTDPHLATDDAWQCSRCHGLDIRSEHTLKTHRFADCRKCHTPHGPQTAKPGACAECHANVELTHGKGTSSENCTTCHTQMHAPKSTALDQCAACHADTNPKVPTTALFDPGHGSCVDCHKAHEFSAKQATPCTSCHQLQAALAAPRVKAHVPCGNCHTAHDVRADASLACVGCHTKLTNDHPTAPAASACTTCHPAHPAPGVTLGHSGTTLACSDCHEQSMHDGISHAPNLSCTACHVPHQFIQSKTDADACQRCHEQQGAQVTIALGHTQCVSCHASDIHLGSNPARDCQECHQPHAARAHVGHSRCESCHEPHSGALTSSCESCHTAEHQTAPQGHRECGKCHEPHSGRQTVASDCRGCHQQQAQSLHHDIPGGCANCHRAHGPRGVAAPPDCTSCHQRTALPALHAVTEHGTCSQCHSGHAARVGFERETCLNCHQQQRTHYPDAPLCSSCHLFQAL